MSVRSVRKVVAAVIAMTAIACDSGAKVATPTPTSSVSSADSPRAIDPQLVGRCVVTYSCGMSHPGLGTHSNVRIVNLETCTRTITFDEGRAGLNSRVT